MTSKKSTAIGAVVGALLGLAAAYGLDVSAEETGALVAGASAVAALVGRHVAKQ